LPEYHSCPEKRDYSKRRPEGYYPRDNCANEYPKKPPSRKPTWRTKRRITKAFGIIAIIAGLILFYPHIIGLVSSVGNSLHDSISPISQESLSTQAASSGPTDDQSFPISDIPIVGPTIDPSASFNDAPKSHSYPYYFGGRKTLSFTTYSGLNDYFSKESHTYRYDYVDEVIMELLENHYQDEYLELLIEKIKKTSSSPDSQARIAISLVQHIPYSWSRYSGTHTDWYYPYETLHHNQGVCTDKALLLGYLLNRLGYDVVLFEFSDHMAVGVKCDSPYDFQNSGYAFIETTRPTIITYIPDTYLGGFQVTSDVTIIHLKGGTNSLDVSREYQDAIALKNLESMGRVLDQYHYSQWLALTQKYDLGYDT